MGLRLEHYARPYQRSHVAVDSSVPYWYCQNGHLLRDEVKFTTSIIFGMTSYESNRVKTGSPVF